MRIGNSRDERKLKSSESYPPNPNKQIGERGLSHPISLGIPEDTVWINIFEL